MKSRYACGEVEIRSWWVRSRYVRYRYVWCGTHGAVRCGPRGAVEVCSWSRYAGVQVQSSVVVRFQFPVRCVNLSTRLTFQRAIL